MTDKQIMIDGVNVNSLSLGQIARMSRYEVAHLFVKLVKTLNRTEDDYNKAQEDRVKMWTDNTNLTEQLKRKEQECNKLYIQLKADEEYHKQEENALRKIIKNKEKRNTELYKENNKLKQTLIEIKEITVEIENFAERIDEDNWGILDWKIIDKSREILQKISEVQNENK